ncbi:MAG TPA: HK97 family phage prohead protease [Thermoanaerobaculia bacterium]|nr:HK97 family phage prohead protease [Thermoanaerobaculia bacterium]
MEGPDTLVCKSIVPTQDAEVAVSRREVTSYKSMFGNVDRVREIVEPGAFASWAELPQAIAKGQIPTRHNHRELVGKMIHAEEDLLGLLTTEKYGTDPVSDRVFSLVRDRILTTSSFQASYKASDRVKQKGPDGEPVWVLKALRLREAGPADPDFAVNPETRVVSVKGLSDVASALSNVASLDSQEVWTMDSISRLSDDDKESLRIILRLMPAGMACDKILEVLDGGAAVDTAPYEAAAEKAFQITELYRAARLDGLLDRITHGLTKCRPSAAPN